MLHYSKASKFVCS